MGELALTENDLATLSATAFACIALATNSRGAQAPIARKILQRQGTYQSAALGQLTYELATFDARSPDLQELVLLVGDLKSGVVMVRGKLYPPGQHGRLYQWLTCYQRMQAMALPIGACDYIVDGLRLPCSLAGAHHAFCRHGHPDQQAYFEHAAARDGFDRCPRYVPERLIRLR
jgi:hypothetical protein